MKAQRTVRLACRCVCAALSIAAFHACSAYAEPGAQYPTKPVRWIVPYSAGGPVERVARLVGHVLTEKWGQQIVVDLRPGANSIIGTQLAVHASPDGYTMLIAPPAIAINPWTTRQLPYDATRDLAPVSLIASAGYVVLINAAVPATSLEQFIALAKKQPGKLSFGSGGAGSPAQLGMELLQEEAGIRMVHVPYKGAAPALTDLVGGQIQAMISPGSSSLPLVQAGKLRAVAITSARRSVLLPEVPTVAECIGRPFDVTTWYAIFAPARTPGRIINQVSQDVASVLAQPAAKELLAASDATSIGSTPTELRDFLRDENAKWHGMVKMAKLQPQ